MEYKIKFDKDEGFIFNCPHCAHVAFSFFKDGIITDSQIPCDHCGREIEVRDFLEKSPMLFCLNCGFVFTDDRSTLGVDVVRCPNCGIDRMVKTWNPFRMG